MRAPEKPYDEEARLHNLQDLNILDTPIDQSFERITRIAKELFDVPIVAISLIDAERQWFKSAQGLEVCETSRDISFCGHAILQDDVFIVYDALNDLRFFDNPLVTESPNIRFYAGCPIRTKENYKIGSFCIIDQQPRNLNDTQKKLLQDLTLLVEAELVNHKKMHMQYELLQELDEKSLVDNLTRSWNRGAIETILKNTLSLSKKYRTNFGLVMIDLDDFKHINDQYGHNAGDLILKETSQFITNNLREGDNVGRWGGEEFLAVIQNVKNDNMLFQRIDKIRNDLSHQPFYYHDQPLFVTFTAGLLYITPFNQHETEKLIEITDKGLYQGKKSGKNKTVLVGINY